MTEICPPCKTFVDDEVARVCRALPARMPVFGHRPEICRDAAIQPHGCPCQHQPPRCTRRLLDPDSLLIQEEARCPDQIG